MSMPREVCRRCGRFVPVRVCGKLRRHKRYRRNGLGNWVVARDCEGSGVEPDKVRTYLESTSAAPDRVLP